jgi:glycyl-tRNA synthetase
VVRSDWDKILPAYSRCVRITRDLTSRYEVKQDSLIEPAEAELFTVLNAAEESARAAGSVDGFLEAFMPLIPPINRFFDTVLVMDEDPRLRENRLGLLQRIASLAEGVADLSRLEGF